MTPDETKIVADAMMTASVALASLRRQKLEPKALDKLDRALAIVRRARAITERYTSADTATLGGAL